MTTARRNFLIVPYVGMAERILNWGANKRALEALTCRGSGDICKTKVHCKCALSGTDTKHDLFSFVEVSPAWPP